MFLLGMAWKWLLITLAILWLTREHSSSISAGSPLQFCAEETCIVTKSLGNTSSTLPFLHLLCMLIKYLCFFVHFQKSQEIYPFQPRYPSNQTLERIFLPSYSLPVRPNGAMGLDSSGFKLNSSLGNYSKSYNEITNLIHFASRFILWPASQIQSVSVQLSRRCH